MAGRESTVWDTSWGREGVRLQEGVLSYHYTWGQEGVGQGKVAAPPACVSRQPLQ